MNLGSMAGQPRRDVTRLPTSQRVHRNSGSTVIDGLSVGCQRRRRMADEHGRRRLACIHGRLEVLMLYAPVPIR